VTSYLCSPWFYSNRFHEAAWLALDATRAAFRTYEQMLAEASVRMHTSALVAFGRTQVLLLAPICPHWCEEVRSKALKEGAVIHTAEFPDVKTAHSTFAASTKVFRDTVSRVRQDVESKGSRFCDSGSAVMELTKPYTLTIFYSTEYSTWQLDCMEKMGKCFDTGSGLDDLDLRLEVTSNKSMATEFVKHLKLLLEQGMEQKRVLSKLYPGNQGLALQAAAEILGKTLSGCVGVNVVDVASTQSLRGGPQPRPGFPTWIFRKADSS
jgi:leucyl-tRNA synthetase